MTLSNAVVTVGTVPTLLVTGSTAGLGLVGQPGQQVTVRNTSATTECFLGGAAVTTTDGLPLPAASTLTLPLARGDRLHAVVAAGTAPVAVLSSHT